jgi:hypothetical protein
MVHVLVIIMAGVEMRWGEVIANSGTGSSHKIIVPMYDTMFFFGFGLSLLPYSSNSVAIK